jgi:hypothetical protein
VISDGACSSIGRSTVETHVFALVLSEGYFKCRGRSAAKAQTVRAWPIFSEKLLLSGIIYGIPDSRFNIVVDEPLAPVKHII